MILNDFMAPTYARFSPNGELLGMVGMGERVVVYDTETQTKKTQFSVHVPQSSLVTLAFSPDSKRLITGGADRFGIRFWDIETGRPTISFKMERREGINLSFSPDGKWFGASTPDGLRLWYSPSPDEVKRFSSVRSIDVPEADNW